MPPSKVASVSKSRKSAGQAVENADAISVSPSVGPASPALSQQKAILRKADGQTNSAPAMPGKVYNKLYNLYCVIGGPVLHPAELVIVYVLLLGALGLAAAGAYRQLAKLGQVELHASANTDF